MICLPVNVLEPVVANEPVLIVEPLTSGIRTPNVDESPFVNVKVFPLNEAVINELAVTDDETKPNDVICADELIVPAGTELPILPDMRYNVFGLVKLPLTNAA
jgi:hypothetical protein